jgi:hypothetical protein
MSLNWLLAFIPIAVGLDRFGASPIPAFLTSALAIISLRDACLNRHRRTTHHSPLTRRQAMATDLPTMTPHNPVVFLADVDGTLLDNDRIQVDIRRHLEREFGAACRDRYWAILEALMAELGYRDYLGALQRYRVEHPHEPHLLCMSSYPRQGKFAHEPRAQATCPPPDLTVNRIDELLDVELAMLFSAGRLEPPDRRPFHG